MTDDINLSLEDIIRKRNIAAGKGRPAAVAGGGGTGFVKHSKGASGAARGGAFRDYNEGNRTKPRPVVDARLKIIRNKRAKIRDARDHLTEQMRNRYARQRIHTSNHRIISHPIRRAEFPPRGVLGALLDRNNYGMSEHHKMPPLNRRYILPEYVATVAPHGTAVSMSGLPNYNATSYASRMNVDDIFEDEDEDMDEPYVTVDVNRRHTNGSVSRTLHNDAYTMPPLPRFRTVRATGNTMTNSSGSNGSSLMNQTVAAASEDPFGHYEINHRPNLSVPPPPLPASSRPLRSILRTRSTTSPTSAVTLASGNETLNLSPSMRARLERPPNLSASMGLFANMNYNEPPIKSYRTCSPSPPSPPPPPQITSGYRIVVSNLHPTVSQMDIQELFEDIGDLVESRLVRPGVAEVIYRNLKDAEKAVDAYHNRQLDGQPMNCLLVNPRATYKPTSSTTTTKYGR